MGALGIESLAVAVILIATAHGTISFILHMWQACDAESAYCAIASAGWTLARDSRWMVRGLAHERTLMAWVRTATSLISFGFTIYKFFELELKGQPPNPEHRR